MARIRTVKPTLFRHVDLFDAERETGLPLRLAFIGLFTAADREGRFKWNPRELKLDCLPHDDLDFSRVLDALSTRGWVIKYTVDGTDYGYIPTWKTHQVINNRETPSTLPKPNESNTLTRAARVDDANTPALCSGQGEGKGREGKKEDAEPNSSGKEPSIDQKKDLFRRATEVLGPKTGGLVTELMRANGGEDSPQAVPKSRAAIEMAAARTGGDPARAREYIGRVLKPKNGEFKLMSGMEGVV